ncbi:MAG: hypothetical protein KF884_05635 [Fimbriimonadaceae bacterium]|nr:hypothetical protein [Fimbriimonadaceae bacterium]QYK59566.1 MAG: hypothetical protein KF884_05635 [Fimbriimonadaceae bacterium]
MVVATIGLVWHFSRTPERLDEAANNAYQCILKADGGCLMHYVWKEEIEANNLDADKLSMILKTVVRPAIEKYGPVQSKPQYLTQEPSQGVAMTDLISQKGQVVSFGVTTMRVGGQPKTSLSDLVRVAWMLDHMAESNQAFGGEALAMSFAEGYRRDKPFFDSIGFKSFVKSDELTGTVQIRPLEELLVKADRHIVSARSSTPGH